MDYARVLLKDSFKGLNFEACCPIIPSAAGVRARYTRHFLAKNPEEDGIARINTRSCEVIRAFCQPILVFFITPIF